MSWFDAAVVIICAQLIVVTTAYIRMLRVLRNLQRERLVWGQWRCNCGGLRINDYSLVSDGRGMLHARYDCSPDVEVLHR